MTTEPHAPEDSLRAIGALFQPGDVIEIRVLGFGRTPAHSGFTQSGYFHFENQEGIRRAIVHLDGQGDGIYVVLNRLNPDLLARADNRLQARPKYTTSDKDIIECRWLYIDCDPVRPAGVSATEEEHRAAIARAMEIREVLSSCGWPEPIFADSGNGAHLLYRLPELDLDRALDFVKGCLDALAARFSDSVVGVDKTTSNAARLCKLYGTMTRKGDSTPERPHRRAKILEDPEQIRAVPVDALAALASSARTEPISAVRPTDAGESRFQIDNWLVARGLEVHKGPSLYNGGRRWVLATCPFDPEHKKPAVIELASGPLVYKCLHSSCRANDWRALRALLDPGYAESQPKGEAAPQDDTPLVTDLSQIPSVWKMEANQKWCVKEMIGQGSVTLISAESGTGKTWLGYFIAGCIAHGHPVIGRASERSKVLYLDGENPLAVVKQRLLDLGIKETPDLIVWGGWVCQPPPGPDHPLVVDFARRHKGLIIYDSLVEFHTGSEQSSTETRSYMRHFRKLAYLGATVIVLHHTGKAESAKQYRGSSDIKAAVDTAYLLEKPPGEPEELGKLSLTCFKGRFIPGRSFTMEFKKGQGFVPSTGAQPKKSVEQRIDEILETNPGLNQSAIVAKCRALGMKKTQVESCLSRGLWETKSGPRHSTLYYPRSKNLGGVS